MLDHTDLFFISRLKKLASFQFITLKSTALLLLSWSESETA